MWNSLLAGSAVFGVMLLAGATVTPVHTQADAAEMPLPATTQSQVLTTLNTNTATARRQEALRQSITAEGIVNVAVQASPTTLSPKASGADNPTVNSTNQDDEHTDSDDPMAQVTSVSQLSDVKPTDWAFQALQSLVERYGCIVGYPNSTYRGNRVLTRYEFAAGLNACLNRVNELIAVATSNLRKEDIDTLTRLQQEFGTELAALRGRVDVVEARTAQLETQQFSTTVKLNAEAIFAVVGIPTGQNANGQNISNSTAVGDRVRLNFDSSFTGKDLLRVRLQSLNLNALSASSTLTPEGDLRFAGSTFANTGNDNSVVVDALLYQFPLGDKTTVVLEGNVGQPDDYTNTINPYIDNDGTSGALSNFGTRNPIYNLIGGAGLGLRHEFSDALELSLGYIATTPSVSNPTRANGLVDGPYGAIAQLTIKPIKPLTVGLTYINSFDDDLTAGSRRANLRSFLAASTTGGLTTPGSSAGSIQPVPLGSLGLPVSSNSYGIEASYQVNPQFVINGWAGYTASRILASLATPVGTISRGDLSILNFAVNFAFPDFLSKGSLAGIIVGMEPKVTGVSSSLRTSIGKDPNTSIHLEGFYQYQLSDNIAITPGIILLTAPDDNSANSSTVIGAIRTTFTF